MNKATLAALTLTLLILHCAEGVSQHQQRMATTQQRPTSTQQRRMAPVKRQKPTLQQQVSNRFNQFRNSVSDKINQKAPGYGATDYRADRSLRNAPQRPADNRVPLPQHLRQYNTHPAGELINQSNTQNRNPQNPGYPTRTVAYQEPVQQNYLPARQQPSHYGNEPQSVISQQSMPPVNTLRRPAPMMPDAGPTESMDSSNYQRHLRSSAPLQNKPQSMDYYDQTHYRHFSNRISATERAILLEDEMVKLKEDNAKLQTKVSSLEDQLEQRNDEIERLQASVDKAIKQLSKATEIQQQLQMKISETESARSLEKEASDRLLDELRKQLNDLLATELVGSG